MAITPNFKAGHVAKLMQQRMIEIEDRIIDRLSYIGESFVRDARIGGEYTDQTGNLRSSIGYVLLKNGEQITGSSFNIVKEGGEGQKTGLALANEVSKEHPRGFVLIVVAGMKYAASVESMNKDVLTASSIKATVNLEKELSKLKEKIGKMK